MPVKSPDSEASSSDDEEEKARMAAIQSVAVDSSAVVQSAASSKSKAQAQTRGRKEALPAGADVSDDEDPNGGLKLYQLKAQDALHDFLDSTFGKLIGDSDTGAASTSSHTPANGTVSGEAKSTKRDRKETGEASNDEAGGFKLFGQLPKRKPPTEAEQRAAENDRRQQKRRRKGREFDETNEEVKKRLTSVAVDQEALLKGAESAALKAAAEAKAEEARLQKELTDEGQRVARLKRERGVAQLVKGRIVTIKEPGCGEVTNAVNGTVGESGKGSAGRKRAKGELSDQQSGGESEKDPERVGTVRPSRDALEGLNFDGTTATETAAKKKKKKRKKMKAETAACAG